MTKNTKNKIAFKVEVPKKFLKQSMLSPQDMEKNLNNITVVAFDLRTGSRIGKYSMLEYKLKFQ